MNPVFTGIAMLAFLIGIAVGTSGVTLEPFYCFIGWLEKHPNTIGLIVSAALVAIPWSIHVKNQKDSLSQQEFANYHEVISWLILGRTKNIPMIDEQVACIYELRHFITYKEVTERILKGLKTHWSSLPISSLSTINKKRLFAEIKLTLKALEEKDSHV